MRIAVQLDQRVFPITGIVQHYAWGGRVFLPRLLGEVPGDKPWAEYWLGVHPACPATVHTSAGAQPLDRFIADEPEFYLGHAVRERFGGLPFLLKVLDVAQMLSIQVHPDAEQARAGFAREAAAGIPADAPQRNYKDAQHKPEIMMGLSEFWLLHGFRDEASLGAMFAETPELAELQSWFGGDYRRLYERVLRLPQAEVNRLLQPLVDRILPEYRAGALSKFSPDFWAARAVETFCPQGDLDPGLFSIYLFNLLRLNAGDGIFQDAGVPHAYLEGQCVEVMANSDNVLRAGLTPKHRDVPELLRLVRFEPTEPRILRRSAGTCGDYAAPVKEFALEHCRLRSGDRHFVCADTPSILLVLEGNGSAFEGSAKHVLRPGSAFFLASEGVLQLQADGDLSVCTALVPGV
ncbi:mannose-6-phosphate isomerase, class I [Flaviaesturariibacter aridisoli]|uniref:mannose-6-phosphate isomerase n=1 Tax=Flaviaesturariibacter aridisoli TaxID=2545761 RepID=A0A4R4E0K7_9BACT|nr:mannose-6-phosphate isomerase, class I [Flaviaesturariibacter aridisoli]